MTIAKKRKSGEFGPITAADRAHMKSTEQDARWFAALPVGELRKLAGKYVAVKDKQVIALSKTMAGLSKKLADAEVNYVFIRRVEDPLTVVY